MAGLIKSASRAREPFLLGGKVAEPEPERAPAVIATEMPLIPRADVPERMGESALLAQPTISVDVFEERDPPPETVDFDSMLEACKGEIEALKADAVERGFAEGLAAGHEEGRKVYAASQAVLEAAADKLGAQYEEVVRQAEHTIGEIVFSVVTRMVGDSLATPEGVRRVVAQAMAQVRREQVIRIRMSSKDISMISGGQVGDEGRMQYAGIPLEADDSIGLGGCIVEILGGRLDARIETQFRQFAQSLKDFHTGK